MIDSDHIQLFEEWKFLSLKIQTLGNIVQNQVSVTEGQVKEWRDVAYKNWMEYSNLVKRTLECVRSKYDVYIHPESDSAWVEPYNEENKYLNKDPLVEKIGENLSLDDAIKLMNEKS